MTGLPDFRMSAPFGHPAVAGNLARFGRPSPNKVDGGVDASASSGTVARPAAFLEAVSVSDGPFTAVPHFAAAGRAVPGEWGRTAEDSDRARLTQRFNAVLNQRRQQGVMDGGLRSGTTGAASIGVRGLVGRSMDAQTVIGMHGAQVAFSNLDLLTGGVALGAGVLVDAFMLSAGRIHERHMRRNFIRSAVSTVTSTGLAGLAGNFGLGALLSAGTIATMGIGLVVVGAVSASFFAWDRHKAHAYAEAELDFLIRRAIEEHRGRIGSGP